MNRSGDKRIGLWLLILCLAACSNPQPSLTAATSTPAKAATPLPPTPTATPDAWQVWRIGTLGGAVHAVAVAGDHLWLGTSYGVLRYDPKTATIDHVKEIGATFRLLLTPEGRVWAAADSGLYYFDGQRWLKPTFSSRFQEMADRVYQLGIDQSGDLRVAVRDLRGERAAHFSGHVPPPDREWTELDDANSASLSPFDCASWQALVTINRAFQTPTECAQQLAVAETIRSLTDKDHKVAIDGDGSAWWTTGSTLNQLVNGTSITVPLTVGKIYALTADAAHGVWLGTNRGLAYTDAHQTLWFDPHPRYDSFPWPITDITFNTQGRPYVATRGVGSLYTLTGTQWSPIKSNPLRPVVISLTAALDGGIWVTHGNDLEKIGGRPPLTGRGPLDCNAVSPPKVDAQGNIWSIGYNCYPSPLLDGSTVFRYNLNSNQLWPYQLYVPEHDLIRGLTLDVDGTPYLLGTQGVYSHSIEPPGDPTRPQVFGQPITAQELITTDWHLITPIDQTPALVAALPDSLITADRNHGLWIASRSTSEVWHYAADQITAYGPQARSELVIDLHVDDADRLWLLSEHSLVMFDGQTWHSSALPEIGFPSRVASGSDGRLWLYGQNGLAMHDPKLNRPLTNKD